MPKGCTKACPKCKKILLRYAKFDGSGGFETRCPHCEALVKVVIIMEPILVVEVVENIAVLKKKKGVA